METVSTRTLGDWRSPQGPVRTAMVKFLQIHERGGEMSKNRDEQPPQEDLERINDALLERVARAKAAYQEMKSAAAELRAIRESVGINHPDGIQASINSLG